MPAGPLGLGGAPSAGLVVAQRIEQRRALESADRSTTQDRRRGSSGGSNRGLGTGITGVCGGGGVGEAAGLAPKPAVGALETEVFGSLDRTGWAIPMGGVGPPCAWAIIDNARMAEASAKKNLKLFTLSPSSYTARGREPRHCRPETAPISGFPIGIDQSRRLFRSNPNHLPMLSQDHRC